MTSVNFTLFRNNLKHWLDYTDDAVEPVIIERSKDRKTVLISLDEYASLAETAYLLASPKNRQHLDRSLEQLRSGNLVSFSEV